MQKGKLLGWMLAAVLLSACKKSDDTEDENNGNWKELPEMSASPRSEAVAFVIGDTAYVGTGFDGEKQLRDFWKYNPANGWSQSASLPAGAAARSSATAFVIDKNAYVGTGFDGKVRLNDFWSYNPGKGYWEKKAPLVGPDPSISLARRDAVSFTVNGKGYVATGSDGSGTKDVWMYDPLADKWIARQSFGGSKRTEAVAFVLGKNAYIVTGTNNSELKNDMWIYDADADNWTQKHKIANVSDDSFDDDYNIVTTQAVAFTVNNKAYVVTGTGNGISKATWEYDGVADRWTQVRDFEGAARYGAVSFVLGGKGHVASGRTGSLQLDDIYLFEPNTTYNEND
ncbi:Kelch repeat-containing protein [Chitinophaga rhizosphaerae]|uniref:Kelch repeat-containing protein n=1 Tax=Chitinophaga rhizosphaerae TaxID=1864947 RepID=UPI000F809D31|nr:kelch repeat-containing protein [Chitinophaga rhizosphaerae]